MSREQPLDPPPTERVRDVASTVLDRPIDAVTPISEGLNAVYRIRMADGEQAVLKLGTLDTDEVLLVEPRMLDLLGDVDGLPVPQPIESASAQQTALDAGFFVAEYIPGANRTDVFDLPPDSYEGLVREAGRHLARLHGVDIGAHVETPGGQYGDLRVPGSDPDGSLTVVDSGFPADESIPGHETWPARLETIVDRVVAGLEGRTYTTDGNFAELVPVVHQAIDDADLPTRPPVSALHLDYRPANLIFDPAAVREPTENDCHSVVQGVIDFGEPETGDGLLDLAFAEDALVGVPLGGTERGKRLASVLRASYAGHRGGRMRFGERYTAYLLLARASRLGSAGYFAQFAREDDEDAVVERWRERVQTLAAHLADGSADAHLRHEEE